MSEEDNRVMKANSMDMSDITFSEVKTLKNGGKTIWVNYNDHSIFLQTPELEVPFDSGNFYPNDKNESSGKYAVKVSLKGHESDTGTKEFFDAMMKMDEMLKEAGMANSVPWFKKKTMTMDAIENVYTPMIKLSTDQETGEPNGKYPPGFTFKIIQYDGKVQCKCFKHGEKTPLNTDDTDKDDHVLLGINIPFEERMSRKHEGIFKKGTKVKMVLRCKGIWITNGNYGCTWSAEQVRIKTPAGFSDYAFLDDTDEEGEEGGGETLGEGNFVDSSSEDGSDEVAA